MGLDGRVALVTGGGRGIGRAISLGLAADGADIVIGYHRDRGAAERTSDDVRAAGRRVAMVQADLGAEEGPARLMAVAEHDVGPVGILILNAGISPPSRAVVDTDPADLLRAMRVHALAAHRLCQLALPAMRDLPRGDIVVISSQAPQTTRPGRSAYAMSKAALEALAATLAKEEVGHGIHVNVVAPGLVPTEMGRDLAHSAGVVDIAELDRASPYGRLCSPDDVADLVRFLVSDAARYLNGQRISVDGGGDSATAVRRAAEATAP